MERIGLLFSLLVLFFSTLSAVFASEVDSSCDVLHQSNAGDVKSDTLLYRDNTIYVGGNNYFLQIDLEKSAPNNTKRINFTASEDSRSTCESFWSNCENIVKVLQFTSDNTLLVCGTNARQGKCSHYSMQNSTFQDANLGARSWLDYSSNDQTVSYVLPQPSEISREIYISSSRGDFYRKNDKPLTSKGQNWFKEVEFKSIFHAPKKNFIYLLFNEKSSHFVGETFDASNTKEDYYSMIGRVCKNDQGGTWKKNNFVTFTKVRLTCPWPGTNIGKEANLYYDELVSSHQVGSKIIGLFRPNRNWNLPTYAVAEFDTDVIDDVMSGKTFDDGKTLYFCQSDSRGELKTTNFTSTNSDPFLPGQCPTTESYNLRSEFEKFALGCTLVKSVIQPTDGKPFFVGNSKDNFRFVFAQKFEWATAVFLLTENGLLKKIVSFDDGEVAEIFEKQILQGDEVILAAQLIENKGYFIASTATKVLKIPLSFCSERNNCGSCNADPHCEWIVEKKNYTFECVESTNEEYRECSESPDQPADLDVKSTNSQVRVSWGREDLMDDMINIVEIAVKRTQKIIKRHQTTDQELTIERSNLEDGCLYEVRVSAVNDTTLSAKSRSSFITDMEIPTLLVVEGSGVIDIKWSEVPGAFNYVLRIVDHRGETTQEVIFAAKSKIRNYFFHNVEDDETYTVILKAVSEDGIESQDSKNIEFTPSISTVQPPVVKKLIHISSVETEPVTEPVTTGPQTKGDTNNNTPAAPILQEVSGRPSITKASLKNGECMDLRIAVAVMVALFITSLFIILYNLITIKPRVVELRSESEDCYYERMYLVFWRRTLIPSKADEAAVSMSTTSA